MLMIDRSKEDILGVSQNCILNFYSLVLFEEPEEGSDFDRLRKWNQCHKPCACLKLGLKVCSSNIKALKINRSTLKKFGMVLTSFQIENKFEKTVFFKELVTYTNVKMIPKMVFLTFSNIDIIFCKKKKLIWKAYLLSKRY